MDFPNWTGSKAEALLDAAERLKTPVYQLTARKADQ